MQTLTRAHVVCVEILRPIRSYCLRTTSDLLNNTKIWVCRKNSLTAHYFSCSYLYMQSSKVKFLIGNEQYVHKNAVNRIHNM